MPQPVKIVGGGAAQPGTEQAVDPTFLAARVALRPYDYGNFGQILGHYKVAFAFSVVAGNGTSSLISLRYAPGGQSFFVLTKLRWMQALLTTAFTTQQIVDIQATIARGFTASDTGAGSTFTPVGNNQKARTAMGSSGVAQILTATAAITAGTRTLDANPFAIACADVASNTVATGGTPLLSNPKELYQGVSFGEHPVVLAPNEGLVVAASTSLGAVGVVKYYFVAEWAEVAQY